MRIQAPALAAESANSGTPLADYEIVKAVGTTEAQVSRGLAMLERYEIIKRDRAGYSVLPQYVKWVPRLDFVFHNVTLDSGRQFNTN